MKLYSICNSAKCLQIQLIIYILSLVDAAVIVKLNSPSLYCNQYLKLLHVHFIKFETFCDLVKCHRQFSNYLPEIVKNGLIS